MLPYEAPRAARQYLAALGIELPRGYNASLSGCVRAAVGVAQVGPGSNQTWRTKPNRGRRSERSQAARTGRRVCRQDAADHCRHSEPRRRQAGRDSQRADAAKVEDGQRRRDVVNDGREPHTEAAALTAARKVLSLPMRLLGLGRAVPRAL
jgi:hypothetical protein